MSLDVYRSCTRAEKREVLEVFWRRDVVGSDKIARAARQYGPWAVLCCAVLALEPVPVLALAAGRAPVVLATTVVIEALLVLSVWWAAVRTATLRRVPAR